MILLSSFGTKPTRSGLRKCHIMSTQILLMNIQRYHANNCWNNVLNCGHWLGSLLSCNSTTVPSTSQDESQVLNMWCDRDRTHMVEMSVRYIAHDTLRCEHTRNANCQHCILATGPFFNFFFFFYPSSSRKAVLIILCCTNPYFSHYNVHCGSPSICTDFTKYIELVHFLGDGIQILLPLDGARRAVSTCFLSFLLR